MNEKQEIEGKDANTKDALAEDSLTKNRDTVESTSKPAYGKTAAFNAFALGLFAVGTALILGLTYTGTKDRIEESQRIAEEKALLEVIGDTRFDNDLLSCLLYTSPSPRDS